MKINTDRAELADALTWVAAAIPKRVALPALAGVHITADGADVTLSGFDYERSHRAVVKADVHEPGTALVPAAGLSALMSALRGKDVGLSLGESGLEVVSGRSRYTLPTLDPGDYPSLPPTPEPIGTTDADALANLVRSLGHAAADDGPTKEILGVLLHSDGDQVAAVATDRFRVAFVTLAAWDGGGLPADLRVPYGSLTAAVKGLAGAVSVGADETVLSLTDAARTVTLRRYAESGMSPDRMRRLDREDSEVTAVVESGDLLAAVKRALSLATEATQNVRLGIGDGEVTLTGAIDGREAIDDGIDAKTKGSASLLLDGRYLTDVLACCTGQVALGIRPAERLQPLTITDENARHLLMPRKETR